MVRPVSNPLKQGCRRALRRPVEWTAICLSMTVFIGTLALGGSVWRALAGDTMRFPAQDQLITFPGAPLEQSCSQPLSQILTW